MCSGERGSPGNIGSHLEAVHPVIRSVSQLPSAQYYTKSELTLQDEPRHWLEVSLRQPELHASYRGRNEGRVRHNPKASLQPYPVEPRSPSPLQMGEGRLTRDLSFRRSTHLVARTRTRSLSGTTVRTITPRHSTTAGKSASVTALFL